MKKYFIGVLFVTLSSSMAYGKDKEINIASNQTGLSAAFSENIARTAMAMGVKEPLVLSSSTGGVMISGSSETQCQIKLNGEKIMGVSCKK